MSDAPTVYNYSAVDGSYLGPSTADPSPLEPGVWLYPAHSTTIAPPAAGAQQAAVFANGAWGLAPDHRGETWWGAVGAAVVVTALGDPAASGLSATPPAAVGALALDADDGDLVASGAAPPTLATLAAAAVAAARLACAALTEQMAPSATFQNAYVVAAAMVGPGAVAPTVDPTKTAFVNWAGALGLDAPTLAQRVVAVSAALFALSAALTAFEQAAPAASSSDALQTALTAFESALANIVAAASAAGLTLTAPTVAVAGLT